MLQLSRHTKLASVSPTQPTIMSDKGINGTSVKPTEIQPVVWPAMVIVNVPAVALMVHHARRLPVPLVNCGVLATIA